MKPLRSLADAVGHVGVKFIVGILGLGDANFYHRLDQVSEFENRPYPHQLHEPLERSDRGELHVRADTPAHGIDDANQVPVALVGLSLERVAEYQMADDVRRETFASLSQVHDLLIFAGFEEEPQENFDLGAHRGLKGANGTLRQDLADQLALPVRLVLVDGVYDAGVFCPHLRVPVCLAFCDPGV